ncbi:MAG: M24 family metallopeptidase, partial [Candidatus Hodarchaeales archaeon]
LVDAAEEALKSAIEMIKPGIWPGEVGYTIEHIIKSHGFKPVSNLTGHEIARGNLHAGLIIPNIRPGRLFSRKKVKKGMIIAIEPFSTNGKAGSVRSGMGKPRIYSSTAAPRTDIGKIIVKRYRRVPFSLRDAHHLLEIKGFPLDGEKLGKILLADNFRSYPPLVEATGGIVAQAEHTVYVTKKGAVQIT